MTFDKLLVGLQNLYSASSMHRYESPPSGVNFATFVNHYARERWNTLETCTASSLTITKMWKRYAVICWSARRPLCALWSRYRWRCGMGGGRTVDVGAVKFWRHPFGHNNNNMIIMTSSSSSSSHKWPTLLVRELRKPFWHLPHFVSLFLFLSVCARFMSVGGSTWVALGRCKCVTVVAVFCMWMRRDVQVVQNIVCIYKIMQIELSITSNPAQIWSNLSWDQLKFGRSSR